MIDKSEYYARGAGLTTPGPDGRPWLTPAGSAEAAPRGRGRVTAAALARRADMARLWAAGLTYAEIGRRLGVSRQAANDALRRMPQAG
jgi:DNA-binding CsgD family transcriptional regulator